MEASLVSSELVPVSRATNDFGTTIAQLAMLADRILKNLESDNSRISYKKSFQDFITWFQADQPDHGFSKDAVQRWVNHLRSQGLSSSTVNVRLAAIRKLAGEALDNGSLAGPIEQGIRKVKGAKQAGVRAGNWLTREQAEHLINSPDTNKLKGLRDRAILALLIGTGLRRSEVAALEFSHIQQRDGRWVIIDLRGKGGRLRSVPMPSWAKAAIEVWTEAAGITSGRVFRPLNNRGQLTSAFMQEANIRDLVHKYGTKIGQPKLAPHDLRRTFAKLGRAGNAELEQIQESLGHASIVTTQRYLGTRQNFHDAPCDRLGLRLSAPGTAYSLS